MGEIQNPHSNSSFALGNHLPSHLALVLKAAAALTNAVASRGASVLEAVSVGQGCTDQAKALGFVVVVVRRSTVVADPVHFVKVRVCWTTGLQADWPELVMDCLEEGLFEALEGSWMCLARPHR